MEFNQNYFQVSQKLSDRMPGIKKADGPQKYNKVTQQKKYHLLTLFYKRNLSLREAAQIVGINYLTAKTILFFHKSNHKSYQFDLQLPTHSNRQLKNASTAFYSTLKKKNSAQEKLHYQKTRIEVICSISNVLNPPRSLLESSETSPSIDKTFQLSEEPQMQASSLSLGLQEGQQQQASKKWAQKHLILNTGMVFKCGQDDEHDK